jgi:hypothetical protein
MTREADVADLPSLRGVERRFDGSATSKNPLRIGVANDFVKLKEINAVGFEVA